MNTMYASSVNKTRKEECASDMEKLIRLSKDTSLEVISKQKLSRNEEQVVFIKHLKNILQYNLLWTSLKITN